MRKQVDVVLLLPDYSSVERRGELNRKEDKVRVSWDGRKWTLQCKKVEGVSLFFAEIPGPWEEDVDGFSRRAMQLYLDLCQKSREEGEFHWEKNHVPPHAYPRLKGRALKEYNRVHSGAYGPPVKKPVFSEYGVCYGYRWRKPFKENK